MIIKGSQRGRARELADHITKTRDNDHVELHELRGFMSLDLLGALLEIETAATGTKCKEPFYSVSLNPPKGRTYTREDFEKAADLIEDKTPGMKGQPRIMLFHEKEGRLHCHVIWSRINERGRAVQLSHSRLKLKDVSRAMYAAMGTEAPAGILDRTRRDPLNYDLSTWHQAKRMGEDPRDLKKIIQGAWTISDDRASFERALEQNALYLARGDKRGFVIVDPTGEALSLTRYTGLKSKDLKARLGDPEKLPTVHQVRSLLHDKIMRAVPPQPGNQMRARHREELRPLSREHRRMKTAHRQQRQEADRKQAERGKQEAQARAQRLRTGIMGLWDRLSGTRGKVSELNAREMQAGKARDRAERQTLIETQMQERGELQGRIIHMRERHRADRQFDRTRTAIMISMHNDQIRDDFMNAAHEIEHAKRNPPTAAQTRRDRAEKTDTMPEIVASARTRRRDARRDREARISGLEGQETATGGTAPENEQAPTAQPEATAGHDLEQEQQPPAFPPSTGASLTQVWTKEQRAAEINAEHERQEQQKLNRSNDNESPARTFEP